MRSTRGGTGAGSAVAVAVLGIAVGAFAQNSQKPTPQMQKVLDTLKALGAKPASAGTVEEARGAVTPKDAVRKILEDEKRSTAPEKISMVEQRTIPTPIGDIPIVVYAPDGEGPFPAVVYFHKD